MRSMCIYIDLCHVPMVVFILVPVNMCGMHAYHFMCIMIIGMHVDLYFKRVEKLCVCLKAR
jgi:hypothetical protein